MKSENRIFKKSAAFLYFLAVCGILACTTSCRSVPYTGRQQFIITSVAEENSLGEEAWKQIQSEYPVSKDGKLNSMLAAVGKRISSKADMPEAQWEFKVFESKDVNAFCLPGGKVGVFSPLFKYAANDAELATVVAHEVGHAVARHGGERMSQELVKQVGAKALAVSMGSDANIDAYLLAYAGISELGVILPYSRSQEYEADRIGMIIMSKAGYNPKAALDFWEKFATLSPSQGTLAEFLSTHPLSENRIQEMKNMLPEMTEIYREAMRK